MQADDNFFPYAERGNRFWIDHYCVGWYIASEHLAVAVLDRATHRFNHRSMGPLL
ncbi:hypothetical protein D3C81_2179290 [compost metagenome]